MKINRLFFLVSAILMGGIVPLSGIAMAASSASVAATVTVQNVSVTVSPGTVAYGTLAVNSSSSTNPGSTQTVTNNGNVAEDITIKGQNSTNWTLGGTAGVNQYVHKFCISTCGTPPTNYTALTTSYQALATNIAASGTQTFDLDITTPTSSTSFTQQSVDVTVLAAAH